MGVTPSTALPDDLRMMFEFVHAAQGGTRQGPTSGSVGEGDT